jgi:hypothetical protein
VANTVDDFLNWNELADTIFKGKQLRKIPEMVVVVKLHRLDIVGILASVIRSRVAIPDEWDDPHIEFDVAGDEFNATLRFKSKDHAITDVTIS